MVLGQIVAVVEVVVETMMLRFLVAVCEGFTASLTRAVKLEVPAVVGLGRVLSSHQQVDA